MKKDPIFIFTGGHHTSGLEVAKKLQAKGVQIIWFGHRFSAWGDTTDSAEFKEVKAQQITFIDLKAGKFHHTYHPLKLLRIPYGFVQAFISLLWLKIKYPRQIKGIVSFGGYLAVPVVISGWFLGLKTITHEQTMVTGLANQVVARFSAKIAISWPQSAHFFPILKTVLVGLPLRQEILDLKHISPLPGFLYITGGKQGSHKINEVIFSALPQLSAYRILHQTGSHSQFNDYQTSQKFSSTQYQSYEYADSLMTAYNLQRAEVVISRAGAHIIAELLYLRKKAVLIPIPWGSHHEQDINADYLAKLGNAVILPEKQLSPESLISAIKKAQKLHPTPQNLDFHGLENLTKLIIYEFLS